MLDVDGDIDAGREVELLEFVDGLGGGLQDVDEALVRAGLELLHRLLVDVRGAVDRELHDVRGQRDRAGNAGAGALGGFDDFEGRLVDDAIVVALEFDANALAFHGRYKERGLKKIRCERGPWRWTPRSWRAARSGPARSAKA